MPNLRRRTEKRITLRRCRGMKKLIRGIRVKDMIIHLHGSMDHFVDGLLAILCCLGMDVLLWDVIYCLPLA